MKRFLGNWHWMRLVRLGLGIYIAIEAIQHRDAFTGFIAAFFLYQAFANIGCNSANCAIPVNKTQEKPEKAPFAEIK